MLTGAPTQPAFTGAHERRALAAGIAFLELAAPGQRLEIHTLARWFDEHVVPVTTMSRPAAVNEPSIGTVALRPSEAGERWANANVERLAAAARARVLASLRRLITPPTDDRFLREGIFVGRVRRENGRWFARPEATAPLSSIVLSLFSVSILSDRGSYDAQLCVCDTCGRVSFDGASPTRGTCHEHPGATLPPPALSRRATTTPPPPSGWQWSLPAAVPRDQLVHRTG